MVEARAVLLLLKRKKIVGEQYLDSVKVEESAAVVEEEEGDSR